eukprot:684381_1
MSLVVLSTEIGSQLIVCSIVILLADTQSTICVWNALNTHDHYNGEYTLGINTNTNQPYWHHLTQACSTNYFIMSINYNGPKWMLDDRLQSSYVMLQPWCDGTNGDPTTCTQWFSSKNTNKHFALPMTVYDGPCPSLKCHKIRLTNTGNAQCNKEFLPYNDMSNVYQNGSTYLYFNVYTFKWYCSYNLGVDRSTVHCQDSAGSVSSLSPTSDPSNIPTNKPTLKPTHDPIAFNPTQGPTSPTIKPSGRPSVAPLNPCTTCNRTALPSTAPLLVTTALASPIKSLNDTTSVLVWIIVGCVLLIVILMICLCSFLWMHCKKRNRERKHQEIELSSYAESENVNIMQTGVALPGTSGMTITSSPKQTGETDLTLAPPDTNRNSNGTSPKNHFMTNQRFGLRSKSNAVAIDSDSDQSSNDNEYNSMYSKPVHAQKVSEGAPGHVSHAMPPTQEQEGEDIDFIQKHDMYQ